MDQLATAKCFILIRKTVLVYMRDLSKRCRAMAFWFSFLTILPRVFSLVARSWMSSTYSSDSSSSMWAVCREMHIFLNYPWSCITINCLELPDQESYTRHKIVLCIFFFMCVMLGLTPLNSERVWTGNFYLNTEVLK